MKPDRSSRYPDEQQRVDRREVEAMVRLGRHEGVPILPLPGFLAP